jgi:hypothetical protein
MRFRLSRVHAAPPLAPVGQRIKGPAPADGVQRPTVRDVDISFPVCLLETAEAPSRTQFGSE